MARGVSRKTHIRIPSVEGRLGWPQEDPMTVVRTSTRMATKRTLSPKAIWATVLPLLGTAALGALNALVTIHADTTAKIIVVGAANVILAAIGSYQAPPGQVVVTERRTP
jgi:hypothetical protein